jgi:DNA gyrase subunit A
MRLWRHRRLREYEKSHRVDQLRDQAHIWEGIALAHERWLEVSTLAFDTDQPQSLVTGLIDLLNVDESQARAIAEMQIRRLGRLERELVQHRLAEIRQQLKEVE